MTVRTYQLRAGESRLLGSNSRSLDEVTRALPQGFYTTFCTLGAGTRVLGLQAHLQRLYGPARDLELTPTVDEKTLRSALQGMALENLPRESRLRLILARDSGTVHVLIQPFDPLPALIYEKGVHVLTSPVARHAPRIKDTGFISESGSQRSLVSGDIFEILLTRNGHILEGMTSNFYGIKGAVLQTAQQGILLGVTRRAVLKLARGQGLSIVYRPAEISEKFDEAFLSSSSRGVVPITLIDHKAVGQGRPGKWTAGLIKGYQAYIREKSEKIID